MSPSASEMNSKLCEFSVAVEEDQLNLIFVSLVLYYILSKNPVIDPQHQRNRYKRSYKNI